MLNSLIQGWISPTSSPPTNSYLKDVFIHNPLGYKGGPQADKPQEQTATATAAKKVLVAQEPEPVQIGNLKEIMVHTHFTHSHFDAREKAVVKKPMNCGTATTTDAPST